MKQSSTTLLPEGFIKLTCTSGSESNPSGRTVRRAYAIAEVLRVGGSDGIHKVADPVIAPIGCSQYAVFKRAHSKLVTFSCESLILNRKGFQPGLRHAQTGSSL
jgi:hypothetical protein